jgi:hypothetical protein
LNDAPLAWLCGVVRDKQWQITDILHAMKCRRCALANEIAFAARLRRFRADSMNEALHLKLPMLDLTGAAKVNDGFAVALFSAENLMVLWKEGLRWEFLYLLPFVLWYESVSNKDLTKRIRLFYIESAFSIFVKWWQFFPKMGKGCAIQGTDKVHYA